MALLSATAGALLAASFDERAVLAQSVELLQRQYGYGTHHLLLYDPARKELAVATASGIGSDRAEVRGHRGPLDRGPAGLSATTRRVVNVADVTREPRYIGTIAEARSEICVPIVAGSELIGVLSVLSPEIGAFAQDDERLLTAFAQLVALAILHAREYDVRARKAQARERESERLLRLHEAAKVIAAQTEPTAIYHAIVTGAVGLLGHGGAVLYLWDAASGQLRAAREHGVPPATTGEPRHPGQGIVGAAYKEGRPIVVNDYQRWTGATRESMGTGLRSALALPLARSGQTPFAVLVARSYDANARYGEDDARLLSLFADQAVAVLTAAEGFAQQRRSLGELERLDRAKTDFVAIVGHEFRTPLTGIQGFSEMLRDEELSRAEVREYANDINKDARRLSRMIAEMIELDRMESGQLVLAFDAVDLDQVVRDETEVMLKHEPTLKVIPALGAPPRVRADPDKLAEIVRLLLDNAMAYTEAGRAIDVATRAEDGMAHLMIRDHGAGLPPDVLERIFDRYARIDPTATRHIKGSGFGLPIVRQLVRLHGGRAWAESRLGQGSIFHVTLPAHR